MGYTIDKLKKCSYLSLRVKEKLRHYVLNNKARVITIVDPVKHFMCRPFFMGEFHDE